MFSGYHFFDYKGNLAQAGYNGQDYSGGGRTIYLILSIVLIVALIILFRKAKREQIRTYLKVLGIGMIVMYLTKTTWESVHDIASGQGFNTGILPFDTCSIVMWAALLAGFGKGKLEKAGACWLATGGIVGGISNLLFLQALKYYPFFTFSAFYSMLWHFLMVFTGVLLLVTNYVELKFSSVIYAFALHMAISLFVIPYDYITGQDFMLYLNAGGAPLLEGIAEKFNAAGMRWLTTLMMIAAYFGLFAFLIYLARGIKALIRCIGKKKA